MPTEILHSTHKKHPLVLRDTGKSFCCDGCGCPGLGFRYRCDACDFDLHEFCATCPRTAPFSFHGQHRLKFERAVSADDPRCCDLCGTSVRGMHYRCRPCGFDVHPVCSQLPVTTVSPLHPDHLLVLTVAAPVKCTLCSTNCVWRYRCNPCRVNLHPKCLLGTDQTPLRIPKKA